VSRWLITGCSTGIGRAIAVAALDAGHSVLVTARRPEAVQDLVEAHPGSAAASALDVTDRTQIDEAVAAAHAAFGGVDVLVNNGGGPGRGIALGLDPAAVEAAVELLLLPVVRLTNLCLPYLEQSGRGRVVNIESSSVREPLDGLVLSNAVRPGVIGWAKTLAREVADKGITVNTIAPGRIDTERLAEGFSDDTAREEAAAQVPARRFGSPAEIANVVCFLASDQASYVTGAVLPVDGGLTRSLL
jgi:3-oxoacyl-[acyl-carrier protein] reductase